MIISELSLQLEDNQASDLDKEISASDSENVVLEKYKTVRIP